MRQVGGGAPVLLTKISTKYWIFPPIQVRLSAAEVQIPRQYHINLFMVINALEFEARISSWALDSNRERDNEEIALIVSS